MTAREKENDMWKNIFITLQIISSILAFIFLMVCVVYAEKGIIFEWALIVSAVFIMLPIIFLVVWHVEIKALVESNKKKED